MLCSCTRLKFVLEQGKVRDLLQKTPPTFVQPAVKVEKATKKSKKPPNGFCFVPQVRQVKTVFEAKLPIGMFLVSGTVAGEVMVSASRRVLEPENLEKMGLSTELMASKVPQQVIRAALLAAFDRQRSYFGTGVEGSRAAFVLGLDRMFKLEADGSYRLLDHVVCLDQKVNKAVLLSLFDYRRVLANSHYGTVCARTDGRSLHLTGLLPETAKKRAKKSDEDVLNETRVRCQKFLERLNCEAKEKVEKLEEMVSALNGADERVVCELEGARKELNDIEVLFVGLDCGKSGMNAVMAPFVIRKAVRKKAEAEAELAKAKLSGDKERIASAEAEVTAATMSESDARQLFENVQVPTAHPNAPLRKNRSEKGAHCVTKGLRKLEMLESQLCKAREERLKLFDECCTEEGKHGRLLEKLVKLSCVTFDSNAELEAIKSRLAVYRRLKIAYNSGVQRKERRTTAIKHRGFIARTTRLFTKDLPEAVRASPDQFLSKSLPLPKRSPQSRQRDKVRGWERGVNRAMGVIQAAKATCRLPVWMAADMFSGSGQRISSTFPFQELYRSMLKHIGSCPKLAERVMVYVDNGYRSSRQAAGTMCYLSNMERVDHRKVQVLDLPHDWLGELQDGFGYFYCPVTGAILKRDPPAALSMSTIGTCTFYDAPHPQIWAPAQSAAE